MLLLGFFFTFFLPGFLVIEIFFKDLAKIEKIPLYFLLSVLLSTYLVYFVSLIIGFSLFSILLSFALFLPLLLFLKKQRLKSPFPKKHQLALYISVLIFLLFFTALYPAIFYRYRDYFVMSAVNWQDTAMHLGIIESISQGNFPPQAPYFSGHPLTYYYFTDFHTAILATLSRNFFPQILVLDNPFFIFIFFLSLYALAFYLTKNYLTAILAGLLGVFNGSFIFIRFFQDLFSLRPFSLPSVLQLLASRGYTMEFGKFFQMVPMADYFLQSRPMMVGLPAVTLVGLLTYSGFKEKKAKKLFLAGLITSLLFRFQIFAYGVSLIVFLLSLLIFIKKKNCLRLLFSFLLPPFFSVILFSFSVNTVSLITIVKDSFSFGPWDKNKDFVWYIKFYPANLGIPFILSVLTLIVSPFFKKTPKTQFLFFLFLWLSTLFLIPNITTFTIFGYDMFKIFYFMVIPAAILASLILYKIWHYKLGPLCVFLLLFFSSLTSFFTLFWSFLNKNYAYSMDDFYTGLWIRKNTPPKAVFISLPTVHSPITQIGGRLRVLSYINWPYSHGFNRGEDNVFSRLKDIEKLYAGNENEVLKIIKKYQAQYIFYGPEEKNEFPEAEKKWKTSPILRNIYHSGKIQIYTLAN